VEFFKKHYEKIVLAGLLLLLIGSMLYLASIIKGPSNVTRDDLKIPKMTADYKACDEKDPDFDLAKNLYGMKPWAVSTPRPGRYQQFCSDLVVTFGGARCGHEECERIIPLYFFGNEKEGCPWCHKKLVAPPKQVMFRRGAVTAEDPDGCGIPHRLKERYGLPVNDPANVLDDMDGDGFSNLYEYRQGTDMSRAGSHPPMWHRLVVKSIEKVKLPMQLKAIMARNPDDKKTWDVQINIINLKTGEIENTNFEMLGNLVKIEDSYYKIMDITLDRKTKDKHGNVLDKSCIDLASDNGTRIRMQIGKDVYTPDAKVVLLDIGTGREYPPMGARREITVGRRGKGGRTKYVIKSVNQTSSQVILSHRGKDIPEPITVKGKIPEAERIRNQSVSAEAQDPKQ